MRLILLFTCITLLPMHGQADELENQISKACLRHSVSLLAKLKSEVIGEMSQQQSDQALKMANESCQAYFKREFGASPEGVENIAEQTAQKAEEEEKKSSGSFSDLILSNDGAKEKQGNKRLRRNRQ